MTTPAVPKTSRKWPITLTAAGVVLLIGAVVVAVMVARLFLSVVPFGVVSADGGPGSDALGGTEVPGEVTVVLEANSVYAVYLAHPSAAVEAELLDQVTVTAPDGAEVSEVPAPSSNSTVNDVSASSIFAFRTGAAGEYTVTAPPLTASSDAPWASVIVAPHQGFGGFFSSLFSSIAGVFIALGMAGVGIVLVLVGAIWWYTRSRTRKQVLAGQWVPRPAAAGYVPGAVPGQPADSAYPAPGQWHSYPGQQQSAPAGAPQGTYAPSRPQQPPPPAEYGQQQPPSDPQQPAYHPQRPAHHPQQPPSDTQNPN